MVWILLFVPVCVLAGGYGVMRALERLTVMRLADATTAELCDLPLGRLYRWMTRLERRRLRLERIKRPGVVVRGAQAVLDAMLIGRMRVLGWRRDRTSVGERLALALNIAFRMVDEVVDDTRSADHAARERFVAHIDTVLSRWGERQWLQEPAWAVDPALLYTLLTGSLVEVDAVGWLRAVWAEYLPDVRRRLAGDPVADRATIRRVHRAYVLLEQVSAMLLGLDEHRALVFAELDAPARTAKDDLYDLLSDILTGLLPCSEEELDEWNISVPELLRCRTWEEVARVPGVAQWCLDRAEGHGQRWNEAIARLREEVVPHLSARWQVWLHTREFEERSRWFERIAHTWREHLEAAPQPVSELAATGPVAPVYHRFAADQTLSADVYGVLRQAPAAWRVGAEFLAAAAQRFGLPVSAQTKEVWYRWCCAAAILDGLVDDSPDPEQAHDAFRALVGGIGHGAGPLPVWIRPNQVNASQVIRATLPSIPAAEQVLRLTLELGAFGPRLRRERDVHAYARLLDAEARVNGWLVAACTFDGERTHPAYPKFRRYCARLFIFGVALDNASDLRTDYRTATTAIAPTIHNQLVLWAHFLRTAASLAAANPGQTFALIKAFSQYRWRTGARHHRPAGQPAGRS